MLQKLAKCTEIVRDLLFPAVLSTPLQVVFGTRCMICDRREICMDQHMPKTLTSPTNQLPQSYGKRKQPGVQPFFKALCCLLPEPHCMQNQTSNTVGTGTMCRIQNCISSKARHRSIARNNQNVQEQQHTVAHSCLKILCQAKKAKQHTILQGVQGA
jgi:hypothetical protein